MFWGHLWRLLGPSWACHRAVLGVVSTGSMAVWRQARDHLEPSGVAGQKQLNRLASSVFLLPAGLTNVSKKGLGEAFRRPSGFLFVFCFDCLGGSRASLSTTVRPTWADRGLSWALIRSVLFFLNGLLGIPGLAMLAHDAHQHGFKRPQRGPKPSP